jgi:hypothetical protein
MLNEEGRAVDVVADMIDRYQEYRAEGGIDAPNAEWVRAEIAGARTILEVAFGPNGCHRILEKARQRTGKGIPFRGQDWLGWDSEAQMER